MSLTTLFVSRTIKANEAKTTVERIRYCDERRGILDSIEEMFGLAAAGKAVMDADSFYMDRGHKGSMTGGLHHNWEPIEDR